MFWHLELINEIEKRSGVKFPCSNCLVVIVCETVCSSYIKEVESKSKELYPIQQEILDEWRNNASRSESCKKTH